MVLQMGRNSSLGAEQEKVNRFFCARIRRLACQCLHPCVAHACYESMWTVDILAIANMYLGNAFLGNPRCQILGSKIHSLHFSAVSGVIQFSLST